MQQAGLAPAFCLAGEIRKIHGIFLILLTG
jgi:hypothetical protein